MSGISNWHSPLSVNLAAEQVVVNTAVGQTQGEHVDRIRIDEQQIRGLNAIAERFRVCDDKGALSENRILAMMLITHHHQAIAFVWSTSNLCSLKQVVNPNAVEVEQVRQGLVIRLGSGFRLLIFGVWNTGEVVQMAAANHTSEGDDRTQRVHVAIAKDVEDRKGLPAALVFAGSTEREWNDILVWSVLIVNAERSQSLNGFCDGDEIQWW